MNIKSAFLPLSLLYFHNTYSVLLQGKSFFSPRSQSAHYERQAIGIHSYLNTKPTHLFTGTLSTTCVYSQSVRPERMAQALFGKEQLLIAGSAVSDQESNDILADYFGLSPNFFSIVDIKPFIRSALLEIDMDLRSRYAPEWSLHLQVPVGYTQWHVTLLETVFANGKENPFPAGYQSVGSQPFFAPFFSFEEAIKGERSYGAVASLQKGKINGAQRKRGFSDISATLNYDVCQETDRSFTTYVRAVFPTGSRPNGEFLFEPILGNGKHWQLGLGFKGFFQIWEALEQELNIYADISFSHLFSARQRRAFDFINNGIASRYILLKEFDTGSFTGNVIPAVNITTLNCKVHNDLQVDITGMFDYIYRSFIFNIGYNGWIRSKEKISLRQTLPTNRFALKGIQNVFDINSGLLSSTTESTATIAGDNFVLQEEIADAAPTFVNTSDIDVKSAASPLLLTHKIFFYLGYLKEEQLYKCLQPFIGVGYQIEFEGINTRVTVQPNKNTLSQWSAFVKLGTYF